ncbi:amino acid adenylation domain-containing protein [Bacillus sp. F9_6S_D1_P_5]
MIQEDKYSLTHPQKRIWYTEILNSNTNACNLDMVIRIYSEVDYFLLNKAINKVISENDSLRIRLKQQDNQEPVQYFIEHQDKNFEYLDFSNENDSAKLDSWIEKKLREPFDLMDSDLYYFSLVKPGKTEGFIYCKVHHIVTDGLSMNMIVNQIIDVYVNLYMGKEINAISTSSYVQFIKNEENYMKSSRFEKDENFWLEEFQTIPAVTGIKPHNPFLTSTKSSREKFVVSDGLRGAIENFSREYGFSIYSIFVSVLQLALHRWTSSNDITLGMVYGNRAGRIEKELMGMMVSTVPLRMNIEPEEEAVSFFTRIAKKQKKILFHQKYPFNLLSEKIRKINGSFERFFGVSIDYRPIKLSKEYVDNNFFWLSNGHEVNDFAVHIEEQLDTGNLELVVDYRERLFSRQEIRSFFNSMFVLLENILKEPKQKIKEISILPNEEKEKVLVEFNETKANYSSNFTIHQLFEKQAERTPEAVAVVYEDQKLTYQELNEKANQLAHYLQKRGIGPDSLVGLCVERSPEMIVGLFGILKAGGAYVPLDPTYPQKRLRYIVEDAGIQVLVTKETLLGLFSEEIEVICLDQDQEKISLENSTSPDSKVTAENLAYVIYTSGSTGNPKGVMIEHHSVINRLEWMQEKYPISKIDTILQKTPFSFDVSVWELLWWSFVGARVCLLPPGGEKDPRLIVDYIERYSVNIMHFVPSMLSAFLNYMERLTGKKNLSSLRHVFTSGEALNTDQVRRFKSVFFNSQGTNLNNLYGPTEATVDVTYFDCDLEQELTLIPIGKPINNTQLYVLDQSLEIVPIGVIGELYIGGVGLARGYLNRPELTSERFISHPFKEGERLYRTGDLVKYLPDGNLEYIGRIDSQVKIRGFRIELGEIEAALLEHSSVKEAVVLAREDNPGDKRLVAYVVGNGSRNEWREHLKGRLPSYMIPAHFIEMEVMPLTPNGKIDRKILPAPKEQLVKENVLSPRTPVEELVASIWSEVLGMEHIGIQDSFFELGGHSLLATQVAFRLQDAFQIELSVRELFEYSTVETLVERIVQLRQRGPKRDLPPLKRVERGKPLPLSYAQQRLWFIDQLEGASALYNIPAVWRLKGRWEPEALEKGWNQLIERHESLRTNFFQGVDGQPMQQICLYVPQSMKRVDLTKLSSVEKEKEMNHLIQREVETPFDLKHGPLIRAQIFQVEKEEWILLCTMHHIISDGWSMEIFLEEWLALYEEVVDGKPAELSPLQFQYVDFAQWQKEWLVAEVLDQQLQYWKEELSGELPILQLPMDRPRSTVQTHRGAMHSVLLSHSLLEKLKEISRREGSTLFMTLLAAYQSFLSRYTGQEDILVGSPIANRNYREVEGLIGFFVNTLVYRADMTGNPTFQELMSQVRRKALKAYEHQDIPFEKVVEVIKPERNMSTSPIFQTMFTMQNAKQGPRELSSRVLETMDIHTSIAKFDLTLFGIEKEEGFFLAFEYNTDLFNSLTIERMAQNFENWLNEIVNQPEVPLANLNLLSDEERQLLLVDFNRTKLAMPPLNRLAHQVIEEQVEKRPHAIAAICGVESITYRELNKRANQLAHWLRERGFGRDDTAALLAERNIDMLVGILAVLKAGGAYVPLDSTHPDNRLLTILDNSGAKVILTESKWQSRSLELSKNILQDIMAFSLDTGDGSCADIEELASYSVENPTFINEQGDLANVFFTSGSTGQPKGAMVEHIGMLNHLYAKIYLLGLNENSIVAQNASHCFDISVWQFLAPLMTGGQVIIYSNEVATDPQALFQAVHNDHVTVLEMVPAIIELFLQAASDELNCTLPQLEFMISTGEGLPVSLCRKWLTAYPHVKVVNTYGATECSDDTSHEVICGIYPYKDHPQVVLGTPIPNIHHYLLDADQRPVPIGCIGEVYITGIGVGRGYLNDPERTAQAFLPNPFSDGMGERMYKTGDLARFTPDGQLVFISRADFQVKVRGYRIELGEIESTLLSHQAVSQCLAIVRKDRRGNNRILVYLMLNASVDVIEIRQYLQKHLPEYMVPEHIIILKEMPLNRNGKIDRKALPDPDESERESTNYIAPRNVWEIMLVKIWEEVLEISPIGIDDNFFDLGGHSLKTIQIRSRIKQQFNVEIPLKNLFDYQTIRKLSPMLKEALDGEGNIVEGIIPRVGPAEFSLELKSDGEQSPTEAEKAFYELSNGQKRIWFRAQYMSDTFGDLGAFEINGEIDSSALYKALRTLIKRHSIMRTTIIERDGRPYQKVHKSLDVPCFYEDLSVLSEAGRSKQLESAVRFEQNRPFDLTCESFYRMSLYRLESQKHLLLLCVHHIGCDGWSHQVFMKDLFKIYQAIINSEDPLLLPMPLQYVDFTRWQNEQLINGSMEHQRIYWMEKLEQSIEPPNVPCDMNIPVEEQNPSDVRVRTLAPELAHSLRKMTALYKGTTYMTVLSAVKIWLSLQSNQTMITIGSTLSGRTHLDLEDLLGLCINPVAMRTDLSGNPTFLQVLERVQETTIGAYNNQDYPFDLIVQERIRNGNESKLYSISFIGQNAHHNKLEYNGINIRSVSLEELGQEQDEVNVTANEFSGDERVQFDLLIFLFEDEDNLLLETRYNSQKFRTETVDSFLQQIEYVLTQLVENPQIRLSQVKLMEDNLEYLLFSDYSE